MITGIVGFVIGTIFGTVMICCFVVASREDEAMEKDLKNDKNNMFYLTEQTTAVLFSHSTY